MEMEFVILAIIIGIVVVLYVIFAKTIICKYSNPPAGWFIAIFQHDGLIYSHCQIINGMIVINNLKSNKTEQYDLLAFYLKRKLFIEECAFDYLFFKIQFEHGKNEDRYALGRVESMNSKSHKATRISIFHDYKRSIIEVPVGQNHKSYSTFEESLKSLRELFEQNKGERIS
jgi:hypothetical protein